MRHVFSLVGGGICGIDPVPVRAEIEAYAGQTAARDFGRIIGTATGGSLALGPGNDDSAGNPQAALATLLTRTISGAGQSLTLRGCVVDSAQWSYEFRSSKPRSFFE
jgi:hypothetical protein